ncbi:MAG: type II toxin-antitoxin system prevent-host-death family antitoxin [Armatimonadota bacterium]
MAVPDPIREPDGDEEIQWENGELVVPIARARTLFPELVNRARYGKDRIIITRRGRRVAAIVPYEDVQALEHLETQADVAAARERENEETVAWDDVKKAGGAPE